MCLTKSPDIFQFKSSDNNSALFSVDIGKKRKSISRHQGGPIFQADVRTDHLHNGILRGILRIFRSQVDFLHNSFLKRRFQKLGCKTSHGLFVPCSPSNQQSSAIVNKTADGLVLIFGKLV